MSVLKKLSSCVREYKRPSLEAPIYVIGEVIFEALIPYTIALLVNEIKDGRGIDRILHYAWILLAMAVASLIFGYLAGISCAKASCGFAKNLRHDVFYQVQEFSFSNIDKFSSASLVTRLTTDIQNIQMAYMMIIRTAIRAPLNLVFSFAMAFYMGGSMAMIFLLVIPILGIGLYAVARVTMPLFKKGFPKYDALNESVEENIKGIRVVKSFVREDYENEKFHNASEDIRKIFTKAERILALNSPLMQMCMYSVML
ncbi:MAG: ABC transporter ATP-binding protein, partial [Solobacterium sp.]|nr:ABC transporter ATP-binding protein [Solobacterium sp.]